MTREELKQHLRSQTCYTCYYRRDTPLPVSCVVKHDDWIRGIAASLPTSWTCENWLNKVDGRWSGKTNLSKRDYLELEAYARAQMEQDNTMETSAGCIVVKIYNGVPHVLITMAAGSWSHKWGFPKGLTEPGEDLKKAAARETKEETGITPSILDYLGSELTANKKKTVHAYIALVDSGEIDGKKAVNVQLAEIAEARFIPIDDVMEIVYPYQRPLFEKAKAYIEKEL
jgi:8-oxo-dGTP pyrophosphatase MutT (NUDIX family)